MSIKKIFRKLKLLRRNPKLQFLGNKFVVATLIFLVWMLFLDVNSFIIHRELNQKIETLENSIEYYRRQIEQDSVKLRQLRSEEYLEKYARENYYLKKPGEEVYIIEVKEEKE